jgi:signal transduction histidine kinase
MIRRFGFGLNNRSDSSRRSIWFWIWITTGFMAIFWIWHYKGGILRKYEPLIIVFLYLGSVLFAYVTGRFTRRLERLRSAAEQINLRDLTVHVPVEGADSVAGLARSFNKMVDRLASQERARRQFFADVAHELRHPIAILMGRLESIQDGVLPLDNEQILLLYDTTLGLRRLVSDINVLSLAEVGQLTLHLTHVNVFDLIEQLQGNMEPVAEDLGITLSSCVEKGMPPLCADADRIRQVLVNLLTNALQHTPRGGGVELRAQHNGNEVIFQVIDNGIGIDSSDLPYLFERFYRTDKSRSRAKGGSGLGLAIVKSLVELHGGTVQVESSLGRGCNFKVRLLQAGPSSVISKHD